MYNGERIITEALQAKHDNLGDIFAAQVKLGSAGSKIMDAVAIKKTWSPKTVIGYEIKVSRQDFLSDQKHPVYMQNCNIFYFVTLKDIVKDGELPQGAGHMIYSPDTGKLRTIKKAPYRNISVNPDVLLHIMFWKAERYFGYRTRAEMLADYKAKKDLKNIGWEVADKISNLEYQIKSFDNSYYKKFYDEIHRDWKELYGTSCVDLRSLPTSNGLSLQDLDWLKHNANVIISNTKTILNKLEEVK
ncbi:MAG: MmcB family DNA repair protein [Sedimentibacter sp.]|uniref:MmcB family DNA repair protein n=1 Tax=Sedimentibacter sp. TaxID=1960295 RepID=UPI0029820D47|nr:MmcB family DNA repair protein [Sedimentibacter sp.]MDW5300739.1 MmcB family DNA repair protein [Sedimentibacter sp.]